MKKALLLATTGLALILAGCSNSSSSSSKDSDSSNKYNTEMTKGNAAVTDKNYSKAADHYESAVKAKKTSRATASEKQANNLVKANKLMDQRQFSDAKKALTITKEQDNGNKKMVTRAKTLLTQVKEIQLNRHNFKMDIKNAKAMIKSGTNDQARSLLEQVTKFKGVKGKYYSDLYTEANSLIQSLPETSITASNETGSNTDTTNNSSNASSETTDSTTNSTDDDQSDNPAAKGHFDIEKKEVNGKAITADDIAKARQQLTDQGVTTVGSWSDNDIVRAIKNAAADGRTTIKPSDAKIRQ